MIAVMTRGLRAENQGDYAEAEQRYGEAHRLDPGDPTPLRYLGELYRHHTGDWAKARQTFETLLAMPGVDPLSRAVALHGLGKMTIHEGELPEGPAALRSLGRAASRSHSPTATSPSTGTRRATRPRPSTTSSWR